MNQNKKVSYDKNQSLMMDEVLQFLQKVFLMYLVHKFHKIILKKGNQKEYFYQFFFLIK